MRPPDRPCALTRPLRRPRLCGRLRRLRRSVVGDFQQGDSRSGEVEIRPSTSEPVTTVPVAVWRVVVGPRQPAATAHSSSTTLPPSQGSRLLAPERCQHPRSQRTCRRDREDALVAARRRVLHGRVVGEKGSFDGTVTPRSRRRRWAPSCCTRRRWRMAPWEAGVVRVRFAPSAPLRRRALVLTIRWHAGPPQARWLSPSSSPATSTHHLSVPIGWLGLTGVLALRSNSSSRSHARRGGRRAGELVLGLDHDDLADVIVRDGHAVVVFHDLRR